MIFNVLVAERKDRPEIAESGKSTKEFFGISVQELTPEIARQLGVSRETGVIVIDVENGSPADDAGMQPQDIIAQVNKVKITSIKDYIKEMSKAVEKKGVTLLVKRGKSSFFVPIRID
jgi:serine protease Do